jgi:mannosyltransferase
LTRERQDWACFLLFLLGFGIRLYGLTYHSLWLDETVSVYLASFPFSEIFRQGMSLREPNPPLYHLMLAAWMRLFGSGEAAVRLLSVFAGLLYLPAVYLLGRRLFSRRVALAATLLATVSPFLVWYSQETRMYALVATLVAWSLYLFLRALDNQGWLWWSAYAVVTVASLYTHLYAVLLLPAELLFLLVYAARRRPGVWKGALAWGVSLLCFWPWMRTAWQLSGVTPSWRPSLGLAGMLMSCLEAFTLRDVPLAGGLKVAMAAALGVVALVGLSFARANPARWPSANVKPLPNLFTALVLVVPFTAVYVLSFRLEIFAVYYLIIIVAPFLLALAAGVAAIGSVRRWAGPITLAVVLLAFSYGLIHNWTPDSRKEEWRAAASYVASHARTGDAVLCHAEYVWIPFSYYFRGGLPLFAPFGGPVGGRAEVAERLESLASYDIVWLVQSHIDQVDPNREVEGWLEATFPEVTEQYPPGVEVKGYAARYKLDELPADALPTGALFDGRVRLLGYETDDGVYSATDSMYHPPSGWIHVTLYWAAETRLPQDYQAVVRVTDDGGQVWGGSLERANGGIRFYPPSAWQPGEIVRDDHDVNLNPRTPSGTYGLTVSLITPSGEELPASLDGKQVRAVALGQVSIR